MTSYDGICQVVRIPDDSESRVTDLYCGAIKLPPEAGQGAGLSDSLPCFVFVTVTVIHVLVVRAWVTESSPSLHLPMRLPFHDLIQEFQAEFLLH
jgi:hypothetical protein